MQYLWRFFNGFVSGVVEADSEENAKEKANAYLKGHFTDTGDFKDEELLVWPCKDDDDYDEKFPGVLAVSY